MHKNYHLKLKSIAFLKVCILLLFEVVSLNASAQSNTWTVNIVPLATNDMGSFMINTPGAQTSIPNSSGISWKSSTQTSFSYTVIPNPGYVIDYIETLEQSDMNGNFSKSTRKLNQETKYTATIKRQAYTYMGYEMYRLNQVQIYFSKKGSGGANPVFELEKNDPITIFPNPCINNLSIENLGNYIGQNYVIYNKLGEVVEAGKINEKNIVLETNKFNSGFYFIDIKGLDKLKFIKE